jgi:hypothetical protein
VIPAPVPETADALKAAWETHWEGLGSSNASIEAIDAAIDAYRIAILSTLGALR